MTESARVFDIDAVQRTRTLLIQTREIAIKTLVSWTQQVRKLLDWVEHDRHLYWKEQIQKSFHSLSEARAQLERCRAKEVAGFRPSCIEELKAVQIAKQRLEFTEQQFAIVRRWGVMTRRSVDDFLGRLGSLQFRLDNDVPQLIAELGTRYQALAAYSETPVPELEIPVRKGSGQDGGLE